MAEDWSDAELSSAVDAYQDMARLEGLKKPYNKRQVYRELAAKHGRTESAFEFRMQNISAVLDEMGRPWIPGLRPAANVGVNVKPRIVAFLERPLMASQYSPAEPAPYKLKLPAMRDWLIEVARKGDKIEYGHMMKVFGIDHRSLRHAMDFLGHQSQNLDEPIITALIVSKVTKHCSPGIEKEFGVSDDDTERTRLFEFWQRQHNEPSRDVDDSLKTRAVRFASVEVRPDQAAFRRLVFEAYGGRCAITGCDVGRALDAAHLVGRDWRLGHNSASDGILLRKDLHGLYDAGMVKIEGGLVYCELEHYKGFHGVNIASATAA